MSALMRVAHARPDLMEIEFTSEPWVSEADKVAEAEDGLKESTCIDLDVFDWLSTH